MSETEKNAQEADAKREPNTGEAQPGVVGSHATAITTVKMVDAQH